MTKDLERWLNERGDEYAEDWAADNQPVEQGGPGSAGGKYGNRFYESARALAEARATIVRLEGEAQTLKQKCVLYDIAIRGTEERAERAEAENALLRETLDKAKIAIGLFGSEVTGAGCWTERCDKVITDYLDARAALREQQG